MQCRKCKRELPISDFGEYKPGRFRRTCARCSSEFKKAHYEKNKAQYKARATAWGRSARDRRREIKNKHRLAKLTTLRTHVDAHKSRPCADCGERVPPIAMDLDHKDASKKTGLVSKMVANSRAMEAVLKEINECEAVCARCHRIRTSQRLRDRSRSVKSLYRQHARDYYAGLKTGPCACCGRTFAPEAMDWDHLDPSTKTQAVSRLIQQQAPKDTVLEEIAKCQLLCAVCHRLKSIKRRPLPPVPASSL